MSNQHVSACQKVNVDTDILLNDLFVKVEGVPEAAELEGVEIGDFMISVKFPTARRSIELKNPMSTATVLGHDDDGFMKCRLIRSAIEPRTQGRDQTPIVIKMNFTICMKQGSIMNLRVDDLSVTNVRRKHRGPLEANVSFFTIFGQYA